MPRAEARADVGRGRARVGDRAPARRSRLADRRRACSVASCSRRRSRARRCSRVAHSRRARRSQSARAAPPERAARAARRACTAPRCSPSGSRRSKRSRCARRRCSPSSDGRSHRRSEAAARALGARRSAHRPHVRPQPRRCSTTTSAPRLVELLGTICAHDLATQKTRARPRSTACSACARTRTRASTSCSTDSPNGGIDEATLDACRARIDALLRFEPDPDRARPRRRRDAPPSATPSSTRSIRTVCATPTSTRCTCTSPTRSSRRSRSPSRCTTRSRASPSPWRCDGERQVPKGGLTPFDHQPAALGGVQPLLRDALVGRRRRRPDEGSRSAAQRPRHRLRHLQEPPLRDRARAGARRGVRRAHRRRLRRQRAAAAVEARSPAGRRAHRRRPRRRRPCGPRCSPSSPTPRSSSSTATIATAIAFSKASVAFGAPDEMPLVVVPTPQIDGDVVR